MKMLLKLILTIMILSLGLNALAPKFVPKNKNVVSNLKGELNVNNGALNYNIPLNLPVGTAGVKPNISLAYNSNAGNGYYGLGWNLTGVSAITRCSSNIVMDGVVRGVKEDNQDNICLDGQRLVVVSGNRWSAASEYKTKIDSFVKVIYDGNNFKVFTKSGEIKTYTKQNSIWKLSKISDRFNNTINYNYVINESESYIKDITYSNNKIVFNYEEKQDKFLGYSLGNKVELTKRVTSIDVKSATKTLRSYNLTYAQQTTAVDKSRLVELNECSNGVCLNPIKLNYNTNNNKFGEFQEWRDNSDKLNSATLIDMNGDGLADRLKSDANGLHVALVEMEHIQVMQ